MRYHTSEKFPCTTFWDNLCGEISSKLWLPERIENITDVPTNSWFSIQRKNSDIGEFDEYLPNFHNYKEVPQSTLKSENIRIRPSPAQEIELRRWFGRVRYIFNLTAEVINSKISKRELLPTSLIDVRKLMMPLMDNTPWFRTLPSAVRDGAFKSIASSIKGEITKSKAKNKGRGKVKVHRFRMISKKNSYAIELDGRCVSLTDGIYGTKLGKMEFSRELTKSEYFRELNGKQKLRDCKIVYKRTSKGDIFYLSVPSDMAVVNDPDRCGVALDPGVRTFLTCYDGSSVTDICPDNSKVHEVHVLKDAYRRKHDTARSDRRKQTFRLRMQRLDERVTNMVKDLHYKTAKYLCSTYSYIVLPKFSTKRCAQGSLRSKTNRMMYALSHYRFRTYLLHKAREYGTEVLITNEAYTSKTCTSCGNIKHDLGANKVYGCTNCGKVLDRDANGARNIMIRCIRGN